MKRSTTLYLCVAAWQLGFACCDWIDVIQVGHPNSPSPFPSAVLSSIWVLVMALFALADSRRLPL